MVGDEVDSDCDGTEHCQDLDEDGYRTADVIVSSDADCADVGEASADTPLVDCDDSRAGVNPGAEEIAGDGVDQNCDGTDPAGDGVASDDTASSTAGDDAPIEVTVEMDAPEFDKGAAAPQAAPPPAQPAGPSPSSDWSAFGAVEQLKRRIGRRAAGSAR